MAATGQQVSLDSLNAQQLSAIKKQLDDEVDTLSGSFTSLVAAQSKFKDCLRIVKAGLGGPSSSPPSSPSKPLEDKREILVPLTNSLYVKGRMADPEKVMVDIGTGFYVEKNVKSAAEFYEEKVKELGANTQSLEAIVQNKTNSLRIMEEVLRQKVLAGGGAPAAPQA